MGVDIDMSLFVKVTHSDGSSNICVSGFLSMVLTAFIVYSTLIVLKLNVYPSVKSF